MNKRTEFWKWVKAAIAAIPVAGLTVLEFAYSGACDVATDVPHSR